MRGTLLALCLLNVLTQHHVYTRWRFPPEYTERYQFTSPVWAFYEIESKDIIGLDEIKVDKECKLCPLVYLPVCGTDNITYTNECRITCYNQNIRKKRDPIVRKKRLGPCKLFAD